MKHPYEGIADYARWDRGVAACAPSEVDPVVSFPLQLAPDQAIVTAGSCFAQHISRYLQRAGFKYLITEPGHPLLTPAQRAAYGYGAFSARYGNIYTSRQLDQLFRRAYGTFVPHDVVWQRTDGRVVDPFRPAIQAEGFLTRDELEADRRRHLAAVRRAFEQLEVLIFTLGLTECWRAVSDGAVFPLAPGVAGGTFDPGRYAFVNLGVDEVVADMTAFMTALRRVNPRAAVILTVSPVPLNATAVDRHVLVSTAYSKAVLRVAAERLIDALDRVYYFPAYEIVTGSFARGQYFGENLRAVTEAAVDHVMSLFFRHATTGGVQRDPPAPSAARPRKGAVAEAIDVLCDEEFLTLDSSPPTV